MSPYAKEYRPGTKVFGRLPDNLRGTLANVAPSRDGDLEYRPCSVTLRDGTVHPCVYVIEAQSYIQHWGVWPADDSGKRELAIANVVDIVDSPHRIPARFANELYRAGESGMGYCMFTLLFSDKTDQAYLTGNAIDFVPMPPGKNADDIIGVVPHGGRDASQLEGLPYSWCLYGTGSSNRVSYRAA